MSLTINGLSFPDAVTFPLDTTHSFESEGIRGSMWPETWRGPITSKSMVIRIPLTTISSSTQTQQLRGLCEQNEILLIESDSQDIIGDIRVGYFKVSGHNYEPEAGTVFYRNFEMKAEFVGVPYNSGGAGGVTETWSGEFL